MDSKAVLILKGITVFR